VPGIVRLTSLKDLRRWQAFAGATRPNPEPPAKQPEPEPRTIQRFRCEYCQAIFKGEAAVRRHCHGAHHGRYSQIDLLGYGSDEP
jgi:hypothetical protein